MQLSIETIMYTPCYSCLNVGLCTQFGYYAIDDNAKAMIDGVMQEATDADIFLDEVSVLPSVHQRYAMEQEDE